MEKDVYNKTSFVSLLSIVALDFGLLFAFHDDIMVEPPGAFLAETVVDSLSLAPIESAWVSLGDSVYHPLQDVLTDSVGYYLSLTGAASPIPRWALCEKEAYVTQSKKYSTAPEENDC